MVSAPGVKSDLLPDSLSKNFLEYSHVVYAAFSIQQQNRVVVTEMQWPLRLKIFMNWSLTKKQTESLDCIIWGPTLRKLLDKHIVEGQRSYFSSLQGKQYQKHD